MQDRSPRSLFRTQLAVITCIFLFGCGITGTNGSCSSPNTAQITVNDALIQRDCGCTQGAGAFGAGSTNFVCTFPINTKLFIVYNTSINHYLTFGNYSIAPQIYDPSNPVSPGAVTFTSASAGIIFNDTGSQVSGQFIVTAQ
jgi:hypothetical protein